MKIRRLNADEFWVGSQRSSETISNETQADERINCRADGDAYFALTSCHALSCRLRRCTVRPMLEGARCSDVFGLDEDNAPLYQRGRAEPDVLAFRIPPVGWPPSLYPKHSVLLERNGSKAPIGLRVSC